MTEHPGPALPEQGDGLPAVPAQALIALLDAVRWPGYEALLPALVS